MSRDLEDIEQRLDEEIRFHIEQQTEKNLRAGMTAAEARRAAHLKFGGVESAREYTRDEFRFAWLFEFFRDLKIAVRMWRRSRGAGALAVLTLAVGIGANTAMFSLLHALVLDPLPYKDASRLASIWDASERNPHNEVAFANFADWRTQQTSFSQLGLYRWWTSNLTGGAAPERVQGFQMTAAVVAALAVPPHLGRWFTEAENEPGRDKVVLLGYGLWKRRFGGDTRILGRTITVNGVVREVIGVLPPKMNFPPGPDLVAPLGLTPELRANRLAHAYYVIGRLRDGVTFEQANADLGAIASRLAAAHPETNRGLGARVYPLKADLTASYSNGLWLLMGSVVFVLLIACLNLANILLARAPARTQEIAVRVSIGAGRARLVRQLVTEGLVLALLGGLIGGALAAGLVRLLRDFMPADLLASVPGLATLAVNGTVLAFTAAISIGTGLAFAILPALRVTRLDAGPALRDGRPPLGAPGDQKMRMALVGAEVALALLLLSGAAFTLKALARLDSTPLGIDAREVMTLGVTLPYARYDDGAQKRFYASLLESVRSIPGVRSAGLTSHIPLAPGNMSSGLALEGEAAPEQAPESDYRVVTDGYFQTMGARLARGRFFEATDIASAPKVMIVNEAFARKFFPGADPLGRRIRFDDESGPDAWRSIVGEVKDIRHELTRDPEPEIYVPHSQLAMGTMFVVARTEGDPVAIVPALRAAVRALDPDQPVWEVRPFEEVRGRALAAFRALTAFATAFGVVALFLSAVGIFGVVSFLVASRTPEIGLRMALGATAADVRRLMAAQNAPPVVAGLLAGGLLTFPLGRVLGALFVERVTADPISFAATAALLVAVSGLAVWIPARRASQVAPAAALRSL